MLLFGFTKNYSKKDINLRNPYLATALFLTIFVAFRCIAHTRMGSFLDIFIIIVISKLFYSSIQRKWIYIFLLVQLITWALFTNHWHKPVLTAQEHKNISELFRDIPSSVVPVALSGNTMSLMT
ncbi:hypothetical protein H6768_02855 [Candidatus Peribacteria bacterium]|nr:hypothetical protein [Candidatus Peribacteria bacterium]